RLRADLVLRIRTSLDARLSMDFLEHLLSLPYAFFQRRSAGDLLMRLESNGTIRELVTDSAVSGILDGVLVIFYLGGLFALDASIGAWALVLGALQVTVHLAARARNRELTGQSLQAR